MESGTLFCAKISSRAVSYGIGIAVPVCQCASVPVCQCQKMICGQQYYLTIIYTE